MIKISRQNYINCFGAYIATSLFDNKKKIQEGRKHMIELGKYQTLQVVRKSTIGVYLGDEREQVLLPKKQVPQDISVGDSIKVFIYRDSEDRLISTETHTK